MKDFIPGTFSNNKDFIAAVKRGIITIVDVTVFSDKLVDVYFVNAESTFKVASRQLCNAAMLRRAGII